MYNIQKTLLIFILLPSYCCCWCGSELGYKRLYRPSSSSLASLRRYDADHRPKPTPGGVVALLSLVVVLGRVATGGGATGSSARLSTLPSARLSALPSARPLSSSSAATTAVLCAKSRSWVRWRDKRSAVAWDLALMFNIFIVL